MSDDTLRRLNDETWTTGELVIGAGITYDAFTNYLRSPLLFASQSAGRGKARKYPLIDVYQVAILAELSKLTGKLSWSAEALNYAILIEAEAKYLFAPSDIETPSIENIHRTRLDELSMSIFSAPRPYFCRDFAKPYFIFAKKLDIALGRSVIEGGRKTDFGVLDPTDEGGVYLNMTSILRTVDRRLSEALDVR